MARKNPKNKILNWYGRKSVIEGMAKRLNVTQKIAESILITVCEEITVALCNGQVVMLDDLLTIKPLPMDGQKQAVGSIREGLEMRDFIKISTKAHKLLKIRVNRNNPAYKTEAKAEYAARMEEKINKRHERKRVNFD